MNNTRIMLASKSAIRRQILDGAGLAYTAIDSKLDEDGLKEKLYAAKYPIEDLPAHLALAKALNVKSAPEDIVIGADQIMEMDGQVFDKPKSMAEARARLLDMRGKEHRLIGAVVSVRNGKQIWHHTSTTQLKVRDFSEKFIDTYLKEEGEEILYCVGGYKFEGRGAQLFEYVEGDFFSILGLSLLPLLAHLRDIEMIAS